MNTESKLHLVEQEEEIVVFDGLEKAFLGYAERYGFANAVAVYDRDMTINILMEGGLSREAAEEYFQYNVIGAWVGEGTPVFVTVEPLEEFIN